jgi:hypothetical protein
MVSRGTVPFPIETRDISPLHSIQNRSGAGPYFYSAMGSWRSLSSIQCRIYEYEELYLHFPYVLMVQRSSGRRPIPYGECCGISQLGCWAIHTGRDSSGCFVLLPETTDGCLGLRLAIPCTVPQAIAAASSPLAQLKTQLVLRELEPCGQCAMLDRRQQNEPPWYVSEASVTASPKKQRTLYQWKQYNISKGYLYYLYLMMQSNKL